MTRLASLVRLETLVAAIFIAIASCLVLVPPSVGIANNGDFERLMFHVHINHPPGARDRQFGPVHFDFLLTDDTPPPPFLNRLTYLSQTLPLRLAIAMNCCVSRTQFDLRWVGFVHVLLLASAVFLWVRATRNWKSWQRVIFAAGLLMIFLDMGSLVYVNSFYAEAAGRAYFMLAIGCVLNLGTRAGVGSTSNAGRALPAADVLGGQCPPGAGHFNAVGPTVSALRNAPAPAAQDAPRSGTYGNLRLGWIVAYLLLTLLFAGSKAQNVPLVLPMALLGVFAAAQLHRPIVLWNTAVAALIVVVLVFQSLIHYEPALLQMNKYNAVFEGILLHSPTPTGDLKELDLPPEWEKFRGTNPWNNRAVFSDPAFQESFSPRISSMRIAGFYLRHPARLVPLLHDACAEMAGVRVGNLANFDWPFRVTPTTVQGVIFAPGNLPAGAGWKWPFWLCFSLWSEIKEGCILGGLWFWVAFACANLGAGVLGARRGKSTQVRLIAATRCCIASIYVITPFIAIVGDGAWDLRKHLFFANVAFDVLMLLALADAIRWVGERAKTRPLVG